MTSTNGPRIVVQEWVSLDGYASGPTDETDVMTAVGHDADMRSQAYNAEFLASATAVLLGGHTYRRFVEYWPDADEPIADKVNQLPKIVASTTLKSAPWGDHTEATVVSDIHDHVRRFRCAGEGTMVVWGSLAVVHSLLAEGLVDELDLFVAPVALGEGTPLLPAGRVELEQLTSDDWGELTHLTYRVVPKHPLIDDGHA